VRVALFITCLTDQFYPRAGIAAVRVLGHLGHEVVFPADQTCCGQPMFNTGFHGDARRLAERMIRIFAPFETVVTPSGSCAAMIREQYPHLFEGNRVLEAAGRALAARTYEFVEFLVKVLRVDLRPLGARWPGRAAYHYSCHLRGLGMTDEPLMLLRQVAGLEATPLERSEQCCGFGGTFAVKFPLISGQMVADKVSAIAASGARTLVCGDAGCAMNIEGACRRAGRPVRIVSPAEIIAEGLGLLPREDRP
jgi:L-lactate dehydrogenase complex protein LldE